MIRPRSPRRSRLTCKMFASCFSRYDQITLRRAPMAAVSGWMWRSRSRWLPASLYVRGRRGWGRRRQRRRYQVARGRRRERPNEARRHPCFRVAVLVIQIIGIFAKVHRLDFRRVPVWRSMVWRSPRRFSTTAP